MSLIQKLKQKIFEAHLPVGTALLFNPDDVEEMKREVSGVLTEPIKTFCGYEFAISDEIYRGQWAVKNTDGA